MSETEANSAPPQCDRLLDYLYEELDEAGKRAFEEHLPTCARCQPEVQSFGRARTATRRLMAPVEPPANLTGALHAQLLHAASQRRPKRGVVLQLFRRVAQHPQMAAAAMFVIVGGAFVFSWQRAKLFPPTEPAPVADAPKLTEPSEGVLDKMAANQPTTLPLPEGAKGVAKEEAGADDKTVVARFAGKNKEPEPSLLEGKGGGVVLQTPQGAYDVDRAPARHHAVAASGGAPPKTLRSVSKDALAAGEELKLSDGDSAAGGALGGAAAGTAGTGRAAGPGNAVAGGMIGRVDANKSPAGATSTPTATPMAKADSGKAAPANEALQAPAPPPPAAPTTAMAQSSAPAELAPAPEAAAEKQKYRAEPAKVATRPQPQRSVTSEMQQQQLPAAAPAPIANARDAEYYNREKAPVARKPSAPPPQNVELQRKKFEELARSNRCDEAIKAFHELERTTQTISPTERAHYVRCLTAVGRQQEAEQQLIELKSEKKAPSAEVQKLQDELDGVRAKQQRASKKAKAAPADDQRVSESPRQQAQPAPAQAAPPPPAAASPPAKSDRKATSY